MNSNPIPTALGPFQTYCSATHSQNASTVSSSSNATSNMHQFDHLRDNPTYSVNSNHSDLRMIAPPRSIQSNNNSHNHNNNHRSRVDIERERIVNAFGPDSHMNKNRICLNNDCYLAAEDIANLDRFKLKLMDMFQFKLPCDNIYYPDTDDIVDINGYEDPIAEAQHNDIIPGIFY